MLQALNNALKAAVREHIHFVYFVHRLHKLTNLRGDAEIDGSWLKGRWFQRSSSLATDSRWLEVIEGHRRKANRLVCRYFSPLSWKSSSFLNGCLEGIVNVLMCLVRFHFTHHAKEKEIFWTIVFSEGDQVADLTVSRRRQWLVKNTLYLYSIKGNSHTQDKTFWPCWRGKHL